jgi:hypothetical protein
MGRPATNRMEALGWMKRCRFGRPQIQLPIFAASTAPPITHELARQKREGVGLVFSTAKAHFFCTSQLIAKDSPSAFSQLLLLQILSPIVKKICKI